MKIVIAGGTGFLGAPLADTLAAAGHAVVVLSRASSATSATRPSGVRLVPWTPNGDAGASRPTSTAPTPSSTSPGESIAGARWSPAHKQRILDSRVQATRSLADAIASAAAPPAVFVSGSAVGLLRAAAATRS